MQVDAAEDRLSDGGELLEQLVEPRDDLGRGRRDVCRTADPYLLQSILPWSLQCPLRDHLVELLEGSVVEPQARPAPLPYPVEGLRIVRRFQVFADALPPIVIPCSMMRRVSLRLRVFPSMALLL
jgi:hypothetical protein